MGARLVILDEPTSSLPLSETDKLLDVIAALKADGIAVIFISHRLHEIERAADRVIVLRDGTLAGTLDRSEIDHDRMVKLMIGRDLKTHAGAGAASRGAVAMRLSGVRTATYPTRQVDLELYKGEILGIAGLVGSGRTEVARAMFGIDPIFGGSLEVEGRPYAPHEACEAVERGVFLVPEDRKGAGLLLDFPITENVTLPNLSAYAKNNVVSRDAERKRAETSRRELDIRAVDVSVRTGSLSGGNQQKVVLAKWLAMQPKVMIFDEPTRGIDIGAKFEIYRLMRQLADHGVAVLMISSDMEEVIGVSDRVAVMHEGRISGILNRDRFSEENILKLAVGKQL
jgi:ribose transport system ATP-binding protein